MEGKSIIIQYMPLIGTFGGVFLGFITAIVAQIVQRKINSSESQLIRQNKRLEKLYRLLIQSEREVGLITLNTRKLALIGGSELDIRKSEKPIPTFSELEMLVNLYFSDMNEIHDQYLQIRQTLLFHALDVTFMDLNSSRSKNTNEYIKKLTYLEAQHKKSIDQIKIVIKRLIKA